MSEALDACECQHLDAVHVQGDQRSCLLCECERFEEAEDGGEDWVFICVFFIAPGLLLGLYSLIMWGLERF